MAEALKRRKPPWWRLVRLAWRSGGKEERRLILAIGVVIISMLVPVSLLATISAFPVREAGFALGMAVSLSTLFLRAISEPLFTLRYFEALNAEGWLLQEEQEYFKELSRYLRIHGKEGRLPGALRWAAVYLSLFFFGTYLGSFIFTVSLHPVLGRWTVPYLAACQVPFAVSCGLLYGRRVKKFLRDAAARAIAWPSSGKR